MEMGDGTNKALKRVIDTVHLPPEKDLLKWDHRRRLPG